MRRKSFDLLRSSAIDLGGRFAWSVRALDDKVDGPSLSKSDLDTGFM